MIDGARCMDVFACLSSVYMQIVYCTDMSVLFACLYYVYLQMSVGTDDRKACEYDLTFKCVGHICSLCYTALHIYICIYVHMYVRMCV